MPRKVASFVRFQGAYYVRADEKKRIIPKHREKLQRYLQFKQRMEEEAVADLQTVADSLQNGGDVIRKVILKNLKDFPALPSVGEGKVHPEKPTPKEVLTKVLNALAESQKQLLELRGSLYALIHQEVLVDEEDKKQFGDTLHWILSG